MANVITPVCPVVHSFEYDARRQRLTAIRFKMDDGSEVVFAARGHQVDMSDAEQLAEHEAGVDVLA